MFVKTQTTELAIEMDRLSFPFPYPLPFKCLLDTMAGIACEGETCATSLDPPSRQLFVEVVLQESHMNHFTGATYPLTKSLSPFPC